MFKIALTADQIGATVAPYLDQIFTVLGFVVQLLLIAGVVVWGILLIRFNVKVTVREYIKGGRTVVGITRAREYIDKRSNVPKLQFFGLLGFGGTVINQPPNECITPHKGVTAKKMYDFIKKDGLFWPVQNLVLGRRYDIPLSAQDPKQQEMLEKALTYVDEVLQPYEVKQKTPKLYTVYSTDGSGIEISRDYESELAVENTMLAKLEKYRNAKPSILYAMYGLAIILAIGSFVTMIYSWNQFGHVAEAIVALKEPLQQGVEAAINQRLGPG